MTQSKEDLKLYDYADRLRELFPNPMLLLIDCGEKEKKLIIAKNERRV